MTMTNKNSLLFAIVLTFICGKANAYEKIIDNPKIEPEPPAAAKEPTGYFRFDSDGLGLQLWAATTYDLGPFGLTADIYVTSGMFGEIDVGPVFLIGPLTFVPTVGAGFDWGQKKMVSFIPQLISILDTEPIYFESWVQFYLNSPFANVANSLYTRDFILAKINSLIAIGPQVEVTEEINRQVISLPVGGHINLKSGPADRIELFLGYETKKDARQDGRGLVGRLTYVHGW